MSELSSLEFDLEHFERLAYSRQQEAAAQKLFSLLEILNSNYGLPGGGFKMQPLLGLSSQEQDLHVVTRLASAITCLLTDPTFRFNPRNLPMLFGLHRWLSTIFSTSAFRNADHIIRAINLAGTDPSKELKIQKEDLLRFCLLYTPESEIKINLDALWQADRVVCTSLALALISPRLLGSISAHQKREQLLPWLSRKLRQLDTLEDLPWGILHDVYMHCSYADRSDKHAIKGSINFLIQKWLADQKLTLDPRQKPKTNTTKNKPNMLVVLEWFNKGHSVFRTHSASLEGAKENFEIIGVGLEGNVDEAGRAIFNEFIPLSEIPLKEQIQQVLTISKNINPQILYMPSVGMFPLTIFLSNLRIAPIQCTSWGHSASTYSPLMDYYIVEQDLIGDPECFTEKLILLPKDGAPFRASAYASRVKIAKKKRGKSPTIDICINSAVMKLNPGFLDTCKQILDRSTQPIKFHFLLGLAHGLVFLQANRIIKQHLGDAVVVYPHQSYADYMGVTAKCHLFLNPFPFGNTNGIIDCVTAGLIGVCKIGRELNEHIDKGLFDRLGFPSWLSTSTNEEYISAALKLIEDHKLRDSLSKSLSGPEKVEIFFQGDPSVMGRKLKALLA
jgi:hypothetical protein